MTSLIIWFNIKLFDFFEKLIIKYNKQDKIKDKLTKIKKGKETKEKETKEKETKLKEKEVVFQHF